MPSEQAPSSLEEFRRKAGPIVAQARGLTPAARLKLADVARQLGIADEQFEAALLSLAATAGSAASSKAAEKFRRRLLKDLQAKEGAILGPTHEARILAAAREKYGLDDATALELLAGVAAELGLQRVRGDEATRNLSAAVQDAIGDHTWIAGDARLRLQTAGKQWGLSEETVNSFIEDHLATNRALAARSVRLSRAIYATVGLLALLVVVAIGLLASRRNEPPAETPTTAPTASNETAAAAAGPPKWWNVDLALAVDQARKQVDGFDQVQADLASADDGPRAAAYPRLVALVERVPPDPEQLAIVATIVEQAYAIEPSDSAAEAIGSALLGHLPAPDSPLPKHTAAYDLAWWAGETALAAALHPATPPERRDALLDALALRTGERAEPNAPRAEQTDIVLAGLSRAALRHLISHAETSPAAVAALHTAVVEHAEPYLKTAELHRLAAQLLLAALPSALDSGESAATSDAAPFRPLLLDLAASTDPQVTLALVDLYERMPPAPLRDELQSLLLLRLKITSPPQNARAIARALRRALGVAPSGSQALEQRWELLRSRAQEALDRKPAAADRTRQLTDAAELAWLATEALALAQGEAGVPIYDELAALYPDEPFTLKIADDANLSLPPPLASSDTLSPSEQQALARFFSLLSGDMANQIQRESALRGLVQLAPKLGDLPLTQARQLAGYLLKNKADGEHSEALSAAGTLRRWKQLRLAVADLLDGATLSPEQLPPLVEALAGRPINGADAESWRRELLESVVRDLPQSNSSTSLPADQRQTLAAAADSLSEIYRVRARLLGVSPAEYQAAALPSQVLAPCARQMIGQVVANPPRQNPAATAEFTGWPVEPPDRWPKELQLVDYLAGDDLARTVLLGELMLKLSAASLLAEQPERSEAALGLLKTSRERQQNASSAVEQLRSIEADLLRMWLLLGPSEE